MSTAAWLREDEIRYRSRGQFEAAVQAQRVADLLESGEQYPEHYRFLDRGTLEPISGYECDGMAFVRLPNIGMAFALTPDRVAQLVVPLLGYIEQFLGDESAVLP